MYGHIDK